MLLAEIAPVMVGLSESEEWSVLTALRGPDDNTAASETVKHRTTSVIRAVVCPVHARNVGAIVARPNETFRLYGADVRLEANPAGPVTYHFAYHLLAAAEVLGLIEDRMALWEGGSGCGSVTVEQARVRLRLEWPAR